MILQSVVLFNNIEVTEEIFYRAVGDVVYEKGKLFLHKGAGITTDTYMNLFDYKTWNIYTELKKCSVKITYEGEGILSIYKWSSQGRLKISEHVLSEGKNKTEKFEINPREKECAVYLEITTQNQLSVEKIVYITSDDERYKRSIHISLLSCTYKRRKDILGNIQNIQQSQFYQLGEELYGKMDFCVIDNGSELEEKDEEYFKLVHNANTGGSGGFTRGILEAKKGAERYGTTHVVFMDDDVLFIEETFYRLYAFLSLIKEEYEEEVIAGRMFRLDKRNVQYTASEIWNKSYILHVGHNVDMCKPESLLNMNERRGEYTGWWFGCFPMSFVKENLPLPFFLHCDDVEYGLRHGGKPIVLNGIQVWHETAEYRMSPIIAYYDVRNSMIVNAIYGFCKTPEELLKLWFLQLNYYHEQKSYRYKYAVIIALWDYMKGVKGLKSSRKKEFRLMPLWGNRYVTAALWRLVAGRAKLKGRSLIEIGKKS